MAFNLKNILPGFNPKNPAHAAISNLLEDFNNQRDFVDVLEAVDVPVRVPREGFDSLVRSANNRCVRQADKLFYLLRDVLGDDAESDIDRWLAAGDHFDAL